MGLRGLREGRSRLRRVLVAQPRLLHTADRGVAASSLSLMER